MIILTNYKLISRVPRGTILVPRVYAAPRSAKLFSFIPFAAFVTFLVALLCVVTLGGLEQLRFQNYRSAARAVRVHVTLPNPKMNQTSADIAMAAFSIDLPSYTSWPTFDDSLVDRGLTTGGTLDVHKSVAVGPSAYTSWGVLGSTLGHEIEIHCRQSFSQVLVLDMLSGIEEKIVGLFSSSSALAARKNNTDVDLAWGTWRAERTAYAYEIDSAERFGLRADEVSSIHNVMNYFYPITRSVVAAKKLSPAN